MDKVVVGLGERAYEISIGSGQLEALGGELARRAYGKRYVLVADDRVAELYGARVLDGFARAGLPPLSVTFPHGEASKNLSTVENLARELARLGVDRGDALVALGGGVTGDICGFLAAIYMRGIPFVQVPTTLLAQVDSSVGGKTGVDIPEGKNLVGCFYQPRWVVIDLKVLNSLDDTEMKNGFAEIIKYGVIRDGEFFALLEREREAVLGRKHEVLSTVIQRCCAIKAEVVAADEREGDQRRILNFGHTIGHAVEAASRFAIAHGHAVAMGMVAAAELAVLEGLLPKEEAARIRDLVEGYGLPVTIPPGLDRQEIKGFLRTDKKAVAGRPFFVLPTSIGKVVITDQVEERFIDQVLG